MNIILKIAFGLVVLLCSAHQFFAQRSDMVKTLQVPGRNQYCQIDTLANRAILPSGRWVTPAGQVVRIAHDPFGLSISPDGRWAICLHDGFITRVALGPGSNLQVNQIPDYQKTLPSPLQGTAFMGVAFSKDSRHVYLSGGDNGLVIHFDVLNLKRIDTITLNQKVQDSSYAESFVSDLVMDTLHNQLLVLDRAHFRLVAIDPVTRQIKQSLPVGRQPFGLTLTPDSRFAFVANVGLYEYPLVPGVTPASRDTFMLKFPPYGAHTRQSKQGVKVDGRQIPGLGDPLDNEAMSVWLIDLESFSVVHKFKPGLQIGEMIEEAEVVGGASPNTVVTANRFAYISNATNDNIAVIDHQLRRIVDHIPLKVHPLLDKYRGLMPFGMTLTRDEKTLYVALLGFNAVAVVDIPSRQVRGLIPTGWGPTRVSLSPDEKYLYVTSSRGLGAGPNGGNNFVAPAQGTYVGDIQLGTFQQLTVPDQDQLAQFTRQVLNNTFEEVTVPSASPAVFPPLPVSRKNPLIKYIVYVTKENRTYDEFFGQLSSGDATLARYGLGTSFIFQKDTIRQADITPNHHRIARQFSYSDNFYCDSDASIHGHHWMVGVIPNEWVEANSNHAARFNPYSNAPGRRFPRSTGAIDPEDYNETGGLWEALDRKKIPFYNFGEGNEYAGVWEEWDHLEFGARQPVVFPIQEALFNRTSRNYAGFNMNIPDWLRMDQFEAEFTAKWLNKKKKLPRLITIQLPNDHGAGVRPSAGYPYPHSYMADNDISLGRLLQFLSHTPYWANMLVIITEDDPQGGVDHIDAHRSLLLMAGPYVKKGFVSRTHANFGSILRVIYNLLGVSYVNQYDATASLLNDFFTDEPDFTPYKMVIPDQRVFDVDQAMYIYRKTFQWTSPPAGIKMDDPNEQRKEHYRQQKQE